MHSFGGKIITFSEFQKIRDTLGNIVMTSGYFDPIHPGHISCFIESKKLGDTLVVLVDGDRRAAEKKGKSFQDIATRCSIVSGIRGVDYVVPLEIEGIDNPGQALDIIRPAVFAKGGDRNTTDNPLPEAETIACKKHAIEIIYNVGLGKEWSSSIFLKNWLEFNNKK